MTDPGGFDGPPNGDAAASGRTISRRWLRNGAAVAVDAALWAIALTLASLLRVGFDGSEVDVEGLLIAIAVAVAAQALVGSAFGLYTGRSPLASFDEAGRLAGTAAAATAVTYGAAILPIEANLVPLSAVLAAGAYQLVAALGLRYVLRLAVEVRRPAAGGGSRVLVFGAGEVGLRAARALIRDATTDMQPVAFLDDDPTKANLRLVGLRVVGGRADIADAATRFDADSLLIAMPSAPHSAVIDVADRAQEAGLAVRVMPPIAQLVRDGVQVRDIRELTLADYLDRDEVRLDLKEIAAYLEGKRVLVVGAGGSIGSQLCETIREFDPAQLLMLDHSENNLHRLALRLDGTGVVGAPDLVLADIRDLSAMHDVFQRHQPEVVFHAAAHKHVPFLERYPEEAVKTNVYGTLNLLRVAERSGVARFVNISTDKAADPSNMLGLSKRMAERLTAHFARRTPGVFSSVRFGNVLGSDGSVVATFREQLRQGRPMTLTHPDVTRYFMTIAEAVGLVVQSGAFRLDGDVYVLDMGEPVLIADLARRLAAALRPGTEVEIETIGLRPGEKLHEVLFSPEDEMIDKPHEKLWLCRVPPLDPALLGDRTDRASLEALLGSAPLARNSNLGIG